jgi:hypothetical protein
LPWWVVVLWALGSSWSYQELWLPGAVAGGAVATRSCGWRGGGLCRGSSPALGPPVLGCEDGVPPQKPAWFAREKPALGTDTPSAKDLLLQRLGPAWAEHRGHVRSGAGPPSDNRSRCSAAVRRWGLVAGFLVLSQQRPHLAAVVAGEGSHKMADVVEAPQQKNGRGWEHIPCFFWRAHALPAQCAAGAKDPPPPPKKPPPKNGPAGHR